MNIRTTFNLSTSKSSTNVFKFLKQAGRLNNLLMSSFSASVFKAIKLLLDAKLFVSTPVASFNSF